MNPDKNFDCDIFCDVIDNFGDAGVCWRLAQALNVDCGLRVRLYINRFEELSALCGQTIGPNGDRIDGVAVLPWSSSLDNRPAGIVIETFGCRLPDEVEAKIAQTEPAPIWINLEYLSAEDWVEGCHRLPSPHPRLPAVKHYFFPGVTPRTGGLIWEDGLNQAQKDFLKSDRDAFLEHLGADPDSAFTLLVFCYPGQAVEHLAGALAADPRPAQLLVAPGQAGEQLATSLAGQDHVNLVRLPFLPQRDFDKLLWASDAAIIRGEDSFARAQLAAKPFIWNIYPQTQQTHIVKLKAFAERLPSNLQAAWLPINLAFNQQEDFQELWPMWRDSARDDYQSWRAQLQQNGALHHNLCTFIQEKLKSRA